MSDEAARATALLLKEALGRVLQVPHAAGRKGTPEFEKHWKLLDPAFLAIYLALELVESKLTGASSREDVAIGSETTDPAPGDSGMEGEPEPALFPPPRKVLNEASDLLERVAAGVGGITGLDRDAQAEVAGRCSDAQEAIRKAMHYVQSSAP